MNYYLNKLMTYHEVVGNNHLNQPLLGLMAKDFKVNQSQITF